jgi:peroxiredoxin
MTTTSAPRPPVGPGERAPDFTLPAVAGPETISLAEYRGRPVCLALVVGLWCPFCRRHLARLGGVQPGLKALGVETLAVVATEPENARLYFRFRPTPLRLASDPDLTTHRDYGVPRPEPTPEMQHAMQTVLINPTGELPQPLPVEQAARALHELDGYARTAADLADSDRQSTQLKGIFLIDGEGIVRWTFIDGADEGLAGFGKFPADRVLLDAARACTA